MVDRDNYQVLGVPCGASDEEIRSAYRKRLRIIHPDRFDAAKQPDHWRIANEMLSELNAAYATLHDPAARLRYDRKSRAQDKPRKSVSAAVKVRFKDLSPATPPSWRGDKVGLSTAQHVGHSAGLGETVVLRPER